MRAKGTKRVYVARFLCLAIVLMLMVGLTVPVGAASYNQNIVDAKSGVVEIETWYVDPEVALEVHLVSGTGFLINEDTVVTCNHVVSVLSDTWYSDWAQYTSQALGRERTAEEVKKGLELRISVLRDVYVEATVVQASQEMDFAILKLESKLYDRTTLPLRRSSTLTQTESVYALGFPDSIQIVEDQQYYDKDDVMITSGSVNKLTRSSFNTVSWDSEEEAYVVTGTYNNVDVVAHSATANPGNSGGPLVDAEGNVVGINAVNDENSNVSYAISTDQIMATMEALGISYEEAMSEGAVDATEAVATVPVVTEAPVEAATEVIEAVATEPAALQTAEPTAAAPAVSESESNSTMIILIVAAVAVVAVVAVVIVVVTKGKKEPAPVAYAAATPTASAVGGFSTPAYTAPVEAGETTVLSQNAGETSVLNPSVNGGTLIRKRTGETVSINAERFVIGRERKTSNYCISDNSSISRSHVTLTVRNGVTYLSDMNTANGTYVNGVKVMGRQEVALKNGDKITMSDEDFEYRT